MNDQSPQSPDRTYKVSLLRLWRAINWIKVERRDIMNSGKCLVSRAGLARCWQCLSGKDTSLGYMQKDGHHLWRHSSVGETYVLLSSRSAPHRKSLKHPPSHRRKQTLGSTAVPTGRRLAFPSMANALHSTVHTWKRDAKYYQQILTQCWSYRKEGAAFFNFSL